MPLRQWVLTVPFAWRGRLGFDGPLLGAVVRKFADAVLSFYRRRVAEDNGVKGQSGAVLVVQRTSSDLWLNPHVHAVFVDGVFHEDGKGEVVFQASPGLETEEVAGVLEDAAQRVMTHADGTLASMDLDWVARVVGGKSARRGARIQSLWSGYGEIVRVDITGGDVESVIVKAIAPPARAKSDVSDARKRRSYDVERAFYADGGHRRFLLVQLPEPTRRLRDDGTWADTPASRLGYLTVADVTKARIARSRAS